MNILLINIDTLRFDKINSTLTPTINNLSENGTTFLNHITVQNGSASTQASIFTGLYPVNHGVRENGLSLPNEFKTIADYFKENGYTTSGVVSGGLLGSIYNFDKGFDHFFDNSKYDKLMHICLKIGTRRYNLRKIIKKLKVADIFETKYSITNQRVFKFLNSHSKKKFFLYAHYTDIHRDTFTKENKNTSINSREGRYNENVKIVDKAFSQLIDKLKQLNILDDTIIIITADHGEDLDEEPGKMAGFLEKTGLSKIGHGRTITENQFHIPLIMYKPGLIPIKRIRHLSRSIDILPTILSLLKLEVPILDGKELSPLIFEDREVVKETFIEAYPLFSDTKGIRTNEWLYILKDNEKEELYNIKQDKELKSNLIEKNKELATKFRIRVKKHFSIPYKEEEKDSYTKEMLKELGYVK